MVGVAREGSGQEDDQTGRLPSLGRDVNWKSIGASVDRPRSIVRVRSTRAACMIMMEINTKCSEYEEDEKDGTYRA